MSEKYRQPYTIYLLLITILGMVPIALGLANILTYTPYFHFVLMLALVVVAQNATTAVPVANNKTGITYAITISLALVPFYGPAAAALAEAVAGVAQWFIQRRNKTTWKGNWEQLAFNTGMFSLSIYIAGYAFLKIQAALGPTTVIGQTLPWLITAIINVLVNLILLVGIISLQQRGQVDAFKLLKENLWASQINILITAIGSAALAFAIQQYDWIAILVFFLPIIVSAYAFRLYVNQMKAHMDNLEMIIDERTLELKNLMGEKDAFLAVLTHDMKTPLTSIGIYGDLIKLKPDIMIEKPHLADLISQNQQTLLNIVNNILDLEKISVHGSISLNREDVNLVALIEKTVQILTPQAQQKEIQLDFVLNRSSLTIPADPHQIERILQNLVSNAIKYTPDGGAVITTLEYSDQDAIIKVADTGYGIPKEDLPFVFDRFRRVDKHKTKAAGTGLGLAITQQLIKAHDGEIAVDSIESEGTTFTVTLPLSTTATLAAPDLQFQS